MPFGGCSRNLFLLTFTASGFCRLFTDSKYPRRAPAKATMSGRDVAVANREEYAEVAQKDPNGARIAFQPSRAVPDKSGCGCPFGDHPLKLERSREE